MKDIFENFQKLQGLMIRVYFESERDITNSNVLYDGKRVDINDVQGSLLLLIHDGDTIIVESAHTPVHREGSRIPLNIDDWNSLVKAAVEVTEQRPRQVNLKYPVFLLVITEAVPSCSFIFFLVRQEFSRVWNVIKRLWVVCSRTNRRLLVPIAVGSFKGHVLEDITLDHVNGHMVESILSTMEENAS